MIESVCLPLAEMAYLGPFRSFCVSLAYFIALFVLYAHFFIIRALASVGCTFFNFSNFLITFYPTFLESFPRYVALVPAKELIWAVRLLRHSFEKKLN